MVVTRCMLRCWTRGILAMCSRWTVMPLPTKVEVVVRKVEGELSGPTSGTQSSTGATMAQPNGHLPITNNW